MNLGLEPQRRRQRRRHQTRLFAFFRDLKHPLAVRAKQPSRIVVGTHQQLFQVVARSTHTFAAGTTASPLRIGGQIRTANLPHRVQPVYPNIAILAHVTGVVILEATVNERSEVVNAVVLRSIKMLNQAAIDAVKQWRYSPGASQRHATLVCLDRDAQLLDQVMEEAHMGRAGCFRSILCRVDFSEHSYKTTRISQTTTSSMDSFAPVALRCV